MRLSDETTGTKDDTSSNRASGVLGDKACDSMVKMVPTYKDYLWGGTKLRELFGKRCDFDVIAESWELSAHPAGNSIIASGPYAGLPFGKYLSAAGNHILGKKYQGGQPFPLLIKYIDAKQNLSVQVHPDDAYALAHENECGKSEMWYVIDAEPGAGLYIGFNKDTGKTEVEQRIYDNSIMDILNFYPTKTGDVFFIPPGTVHAIGAGNLLCEVQQSSNCTYRLYDYDRRDKLGNPRELHLKKALDVLIYNRYVRAAYEKAGSSICCDSFEVNIIDLSGRKAVPLVDDSFHAITCVRGNGILQLEEEMDIKAGDTVFIPAVNNTLQIEGSCSLILSNI